MVKLSKSREKKHWGNVEDEEKIHFGKSIKIERRKISKNNGDKVRRRIAENVGDQERITI